MNNQPTPTIRKFNPGMLQSDQEIREQFVVREHELALVLDELRGNIASPSCQHILVVGPRGRGKTMLLARIAAELRSHEDFAGSMLPVRFMEESHEIFSLTDFWLETIFHLANEVDEYDASLARQLRDTQAALSPRWREQVTEAQARAAVFEAAERLGKRLVLIVENLQSLCRDAHDEFGWQLREVLQTEPQIVLLASATSRFRTLDNVDEPFFEMFRIVSLEPLDTEECGRLWEVVSGKPASPWEVRPLQILTGGNPRLLVTAAEFARHRSFRRLMSELITVIDEHTEYFRGHLEALAKTERRVYVSAIDLWQPSSASEIATRARVDIRVASTMLGRLVERGAIVRQGRGRKRLYAAAEPLYSMYYKLRRERGEAAVVENLIRFMVACYGVGDLLKFRGPLFAEAAESKALRRGIERALSGRPPAEDLGVAMKWRVIQAISDSAGVYAADIATDQLSEAIREAVDASAFDTMIQLVDEYVASGWLEKAGIMRDMRTSWIAHVTAYANARLGNPRAVIITAGRVESLADSRNVDVLRNTAGTLLLRATAQWDLHEFSAAIATCDSIVERYGRWKHPPFGEVVAGSLFTRGLCRAQLGDDQSGIGDYEEVVSRFGDSESPGIQNKVASALMNKGFSYRHLGDADREIQSYDDVIKRFDGSGELGLRTSVALALSFRSMAQAEVGRASQALAGCRELEPKILLLARGDDGQPNEEPWHIWFKWRTAATKSLALAVQEDQRAALGSFQAAYALFPPNNEMTINEMLHLIPALVAAGTPPGELLQILAGDVRKAVGLQPLIVALCGHMGHRMRAPREVVEIAADLRGRFDEARERLSKFR